VIILGSELVLRHLNSSRVYFNFVVKRPNSKSCRKNEYKNTEREKRNYSKHTDAQSKITVIAITKLLYGSI